MAKRKSVLTGRVVDPDNPLTLGELCRACALHAEAVVEMVDAGVLEPADRRVTYVQWRFSRRDVSRTQVVLRLQRDLGVNLAGAALALELLDEVQALRQRLRAFEPPAER